MNKNNLLKLYTDNVYATLQPVALEAQLASVSCGWFSLCGAIGKLYIDKVAWCNLWEYGTIFNMKYFIINNNIAALCSRNRLAVLTCTYIHKQVAVYWRVKMTHTHTYTFPWSSVHKHTSRGATLFSISSASITYTNK